MGPRQEYPSLFAGRRGYRRRIVGPYATQSGDAMDTYSYELLALFSTVLPMERPATSPYVPVADEPKQPAADKRPPAAPQNDDEAITGAGGAYM